MEASFRIDKNESLLIRDVGPSMLAQSADLRARQMSHVNLPGKDMTKKPDDFGRNPLPRHSSVVEP